MVLYHAIQRKVLEGLVQKSLFVSALVLGKFGQIGYVFESLKHCLIMAAVTNTNPTA